MRFTKVDVLRLAIVAVLGTGFAPQSQSPIAAALDDLGSRAGRDDLDVDMSALTRFYSGRKYQPAWTVGGALSDAGREALDAMARADQEGLNLADYRIDALRVLAGRRDAARAADLDVQLSAALAKYAHHVGWGITLPSEVDSAHTYAERPFDAASVLGRLAGAKDVSAALTEIGPSTFVYGLLKKALAELRRIEASRAWKTMSDGPSLKPGATGPRVAELKARLVERGDLTPAQLPGEMVDDTVVAAVKRFQERHGLAEDGVAGRSVVSELNVPVSQRVLQVRLAMERLRWLPHVSAGRRIAVNLADFRAYVLDGEAVTFETRTVIGKQFHETPMFTGLMTYVVINPYWNVPPSIVRAEIMPKIKADAGYLQKNHMEMDGASVRQLPGPWNSLGRFKFMFPNPHNVYLHDTPAHALFAEADRAFSHGCVRLEKPADLAAVLLAAQGWSPEKVKQAVDGGERTVVTLDVPIPVTISYATTFLTPDGLLHYRRDVYGRDRKLIDALNRRSRGVWH